MAIRLPRDDEPGPFEAGMDRCNCKGKGKYQLQSDLGHSFWVGVSPDQHNPGCGHCHGSGWRLVPVVREPVTAGFFSDLVSPGNPSLNRKDGGQPDGSYVCGGCGAKFAPGERVAEWNSRQQVGDCHGMGCPRCGWYKIVGVYGAKDGGA